MLTSTPQLHEFGLVLMQYSEWNLAAELTIVARCQRAVC